MKNGTKHRSYILTLNNPTVSLEDIKELAVKEGACSFVGQAEKGESGTEHYQFCFQFRNPRSFRSVKSLFEKAHIEPCKSYPDSVEYCRKLDTRIGTPVTHNPPKKRLAKADRKQQNADILAKGPEFAVQDGLCSLLSYRRLVESHTLYQLRTAKHEPLASLSNLWFVGPSGVGKSRKARSIAPDAYVKLPNKWWDGYLGQDDVIIDDLAKEHSCLRTHILQWADHYPTPVEIKGATMLIRPKRIIVTSNYLPNEIWEEPKDAQPIMRRFEI